MATAAIRSTGTVPIPEVLDDIPTPSRRRSANLSDTVDTRSRPKAGSQATVSNHVALLSRRVIAAARRQDGSVLLTGRSGALYEVKDRLAEIAPAVADRLQCLDIQTLARQIVDTCGVRVCTDHALVDQAWWAAWARVGGRPEFGTVDASGRWRDEIAGAIKGRGVVRFSDYSDGTDAAALAAWDLYVAYSEELTARFAHDEADLVAIALDELQHSPAPMMFGAVVIDQVPPLTPAMVALLHEVGQHS